MSAPLSSLEAALKGGGLVAKTGLRVNGSLENCLEPGAGARILMVKDATIRDQGGRVVFSARDRILPLPLGSKVISVFGGAADRRSYLLSNRRPVKKVESHKTNLTDENRELNVLYREVREFRDSGENDPSLLARVLQKLDEHHPEDWLLRLELLELFAHLSPTDPVARKLKDELNALKTHTPDFREFIERGMELI